MSAKKSIQPIKKDIRQQKAIDEKIKTERVTLSHPNGKERFENALKNAKKKANPGNEN
ncbi:MAG TPA: hypothetical protein VLG36_00680 [Candidatus Chromulinivoraceae bacterium]|nr:hypothetical protein [Candidatus Chromulinivoraceae bacterium]